ncbi:MAG: DUF6476 family protein [Pseudomonadota bacterium]
MRDDMDGQMPESEARGLRLLRRLVTVLTAVMIVGVSTIVVLLALRLNRPAPPMFPESMALPEGAVPQAVTRGEDFLIVVTEDGRILVFDPSGAELRQEITLDPPG